MAVSKKKNQPQAYKVPRNLTKPKSENPRWLVPAMGTLLLGGTLWIVVYYLSSTEYPLPIGQANMFVGFGMLLAGMGLATRWR